MLVTGRAPFHEANDSETLTMILDCKFFLPPHVSDSCCDLISRMIVREPELRITIENISSHEWLITPLQPPPSQPPQPHSLPSSHYHQHQSNRSNSTFDEDHLGFIDDAFVTPSSSMRLLESNESSDDNGCWSVAAAVAAKRRTSSRRSSSGSCSSLTHTSQQVETYDNDNPELAFNLNNPIIKRENLTEKDNREILKIMVNGNIASEQEISK